MVRPIFFALVSGSYIYFGAFEILASELIENKKMITYKFICFALGNAVVVVILAFVTIAF